MFVYLVCQDYTDQLRYAGKNQVGMERFFILCPTAGEPKAVLEMADGTLHRGSEPDQKSETKNWLWVYLLDGNSDGPHMVLFQYGRTRGGYHPKEFLKGFRGYLTTDGYQSYQNLSEEIVVTGCMAHSRRRFEECLGILKKQVPKE